ncbi:MAG: hypothetical protein ACTHJ1_05135, partial [Bordetella sp.]|uniref:hypothetical protein n=1 Tax=Bordetella sp. TaxID=28081 RepID=UPI003F7BE11C
RYTGFTFLQRGNDLAFCKSGFLQGRLLTGEAPNILLTTVYRTGKLTNAANADLIIFFIEQDLTVQ